jgi:hypothetical protein
MVVAEGAGEPVPPGEVEGAVEAGVEVVDVVVLGALREGREEDAQGAGRVDPEGQAVAAVAHHVHAVHGPHEAHHGDGVPRGLPVDVRHHGRVEGRERHGDVEDVPVRRAEHRQVAARRVVPLVHAPVQRLAVVHRRVHREEVGVVEHHHRPREQQAAHHVARNLTPAHEPIPAPKKSINLNHP